MKPGTELMQITAAEWTLAAARHLLDRAGFGGTPEEVAALHALGPEGAVRRLVRHDGAPDGALPPFQDSGFWDPSLADFPPSRPAATELAARTGAAMGVRVRPGGPRPMQPVVDRFFFWLRASALETRRLAQWWVDRMVRTPRPLEEKLALFWHGHFATGHEKVRDWRKMHQQLGLLRALGPGSFPDLLLAVARSPAMLVYLDAGENVKGSPNENFAREVMELFTMGVGNYSETDVREAARAFTGWTNDDLEFVFDRARHDDGDKSFLGQHGAFRGEDILRIICEQPVTARFIAGRLYRFFVRDELAPELEAELGALLRANGLRIAPFLEALFLSRAFYAEAVRGAHIKSPVELVVGCCRHLRLDGLPGVPDLHVTGKALGQVLFDPPTVAGWACGKTWITPGLLFERANLARAFMFPDMVGFCEPYADVGDELRRVNANIRAGQEIGEATREPDAPPDTLATRTEAFNTHYASLAGWQQALRQLRPTPRAPAQFSLSHGVHAAGIVTAAAAVSWLAGRLLAVPLARPEQEAMVAFLAGRLGTDDLSLTASFDEEPLREVAHAIMSTPQYQLS